MNGIDYRDWRDDSLSPRKSFKTFDLNRFKYAIMQHISDMEIVESDIDIFYEYLPERMAHAISVRFSPFGEQIYFEEVRYPSDWWQAFKERWFPKWLTRRYPIRYNDHKIDVKALYTKISMPPDQQVYHGLVMDAETRHSYQ